MNLSNYKRTKLNDAGFVIPNDPSVNCIDWISALLNCDDVSLPTKLSLLGVDSMMLSIKDDAAADAGTDNDDDSDDGDDDELMMLKASRSLAESASYMHTLYCQQLLSSFHYMMQIALANR